MTNMTVGNKLGQRLLLSYCSFTCIYFPGILILLKLNDNLYNVGKYKFIPVLLILLFAEVIKLLFPMFQSDSIIIGKTELRTSSKARKSWSKYLKEIFKFLLAAFLLSVIYYIIIVLFGAPVFMHHEETTMLTLTLTTLTFVPASLHLGVDGVLEIMTGTQSQKGNVLVDAVKTNIQATLLGTWLGAIVIPLDWDRPWQAWPIPCVIGALLGYMIAHFITLAKTLPMLKLAKKVHR
ncbi:phosphatidylinositol-glycan biosynthesis class F protein [Hylaeus volcanicus]|uniref:phosphatidylinositol-glycan biosynthesis class F protein n=1 Tax=Hylaeus volcanicus TaxID=313075 RepID=UPI0023B77EEC|nr:phosphatidylinositol-glycan biosynthesis class F protein [Hylaeus volcanicus]XP_053980380.1 phosphatidylinositol-glycan biosynthesis class F protein [Hylaeus volcanicus]XP_053980381.1 phosphatidylinositol-glycan biosynthesis class F protein [Hylaeus volcanicus]